MKYLLRYFQRISIGIYMLLSFHIHGAAIDNTVDALLRNPSIRHTIAESLRNLPHSKTVTPFNAPKDPDMDLLRTILPPASPTKAAAEALRFRSDIWATLAKQGTVSRHVVDGKSMIIIFFEGSRSSEIDSIKAWEPCSDQNCRLPSNELLANFFAGATEPSSIQINYSHAILALYLQNALWSILDPITSTKDAAPTFVLTGHGSGGLTAQIFSLMLFQRLKTMGAPSDKVNVVTFGSPRPFKYKTAAYVRKTLGSRIRTFVTSTLDGKPDPLSFSPDTLLLPSREPIPPFSWAIMNDPHSLAADNNAWVHPVDVTRLRVETTHASLLKGIGPTHLLTYAKAFEEQGGRLDPAPEEHIAAAAVAAIKVELASRAAPLPSPGVAAPTPAPAPASLPAPPLAPAPAPSPAPMGGCGGTAGGVTAEDRADSWWSFGNLLSPSAPAPAHVLTPPGAASAAIAPSPLGSPVAPLSPPAPPPAGLAATVTGFLGGYIPAGVTAALSTVTGAVADRLGTAATTGAEWLAIGTALLSDGVDAVKREGGKIIFASSLADTNRRFEKYRNIFQIALTNNEASFDILNRLAIKDSIAKGYTAILLAFGFGTPINLPLATRYAQEVATEMENSAWYELPEAQLLFGHMLTTGLVNQGPYADKKKRLEKAKEFYTKAATTGNTEAYYYLGELARLEGNKEEAYKQLTIAVGTYDHPLAHNSLGELYYEDRKFLESQNRFDRAIVLAHSADAHYNLGRLYYEQHKVGTMSPADRRKESKSELSKAAAQGHTGAYTLLGSILYEEGDLGGALSHFKKAADTNLTPITAGLANVFKPREAATAEAHFKLYLMFRTGHGIDVGKPDLAKAQIHLEHAATLGHTDAKTLWQDSMSASLLNQRAEVFYKLANMYYSGTEAPLDLKAADLFFWEAANNASAHASFASAVVQLEMLGNPSLVALPAHSSEARGGSTSTPAARTTTVATTSPMSFLSAAMSTPLSAAEAARSRGTAAGGTVRSLPEEIQRPLQYAADNGCGEAKLLLGRLRTEGLDRVATSIYIKRNPRPGVKARINPFEAAAT